MVHIDDYWHQKPANTKKRQLYDPKNDCVYSANAGDYWNVPEDHIFKNENGDNLWLIENGEVIKKTVRKSDLLDSIYEAKKAQDWKFKQRKSIGKNRLFYLTTTHGSYIIDDKGQMTQKQNPKNLSSTWLFNGIADRYGHHIEDWETALKNPNKEKYIGKYVIDLDNGTTRIQGGKITYFYEKIMRK